jgi:hypothetical protein
MVIVSKILIAIGHVLRSINIEVLTLAVGDVEAITLGNLVVFSEVCAQEGSVGLTVDVLEDLVVNETYTEKGEKLPSGSHLGEIANTAHGLNTEPETTAPCENAVAVESVVKMAKTLTVLNWDVI